MKSPSACKTMLLTAAVLMAGHAFAEETESSALTSATIDQVRTKCAEYIANPQMKPVKIVISCKEARQVWQPLRTYQKPIPNGRSVSAGVRMKSFEVPYISINVKIQDTKHNCEVLERVTQQVEPIDVMLGCEDLKAIDDLGEYCHGVIDQRLGSDPDIVAVSKTGETFDTCTGLK